MFGIILNSAKSFFGIRSRYLSLMLFCLMFVSVSLAGENASQRQNSKEGKLGWVNLGYGGSSVGKSFGASYSQQLAGGLLSGRFIYNREDTSILFSGPAPAERVWDIGMLYGLMGKEKYAMASISAGLSVVGGVHRGEFLYRTTGIFGRRHYEKNEFSNIGIPVELQLFITPFAFLGLGFYGFANLNAEESFAGGLICLQLGKLR